MEPIATNIALPTNFAPVAPRDTNALALGFHYSPLDYVFSSVEAKTDIRFEPGTVLGWFDSFSPTGYGISVDDGATVSFNGSATSPCWVVRYDTSQEGGNGAWTPTGWLGCIISGGSASGPANGSRLVANFTKFSSRNFNDSAFRDSSGFLVTRFNDCEFWVAGCGGYNISDNFTNCLIFRWPMNVISGNSNDALTLQNCTLNASDLNWINIQHYSSSTWPVKIINCAFDGVTFQMDDYSHGNTNITYCDYNAYTNAVDPFPTGGSSDQKSVTFNWQSGPLGDFYSPTNSQLIDTGSTTADRVGLYWFTTQTNQAIEGISPVDIGFHYVALGADGNPVSTLVSGVPDYVSDTNGNGLPDAWELQYFGNLTHFASDLDVAGDSLLYDYQHGIDPTSLLALWHLDSADWIGSPGQVPIATNLLDLVPGAISNAVHVADTNSNLRYKIVESNGHTNLALQNGSVMFWFKPDWSSVDQGGTGPGIIALNNEVDAGALISVDSTAGYWGLYFDPDGESLSFSASDGTNSSGDLSGTISWVSGQWHQIAITYSPSNSTLYVDGTAVDETNGVPYVPVFDDFADENNFTVGNDRWIDPVEGTIDELATFGLPLSGSAIFENYLSISNSLVGISISQQPQSQSLMVGSNVTFSVAAGSILPLYYLWYFNTNTPLVGATNPSLTFTVQPTNRGTFSVVVTNIVTSVVSSNATLTLFGDSDGNGLGDEWEMEYFGHLGNDPNAVDGVGHTLLYDYSNGIDPISFLLSVTNHFVNTISVPVKVLVTGGIPYYYTYADLTNASAVTNITGAGSNWYAYVSSSITVTFNPTEGEHDIWVGLRDSPTNAVPAWMEIVVTFDTNAPVITLTNPAEASTVSEPMIQIQGYVNKNVRAITFDVTNAAGLLTNQTGYITGEFLDTNTADFTTNYFQLYDLPVTNGANTIIVHATDLAGNIATTNLDVILDYASDTTPPVLRLVWPQDGAPIANSNFTMQAEIDEILASVSATIVDPSGNTNVVSGSVQRNGDVWLPNLPLAPGSNTVTITATDPAGNSSTTNINVIGSPPSDPITMEPIATLNQPSVTVSGTVSGVANASSVKANGVPGTLDGSGNWTVQNVPVNATGVASVEVDVLDSSGKLLAEQVFHQQQPVAATRIMFSDSEDWVNHDHFGNIISNHVIVVAQDCWQPAYSYQDFLWTLDVGGFSRDFTENEADQFCSDGVATAETDQYYTPDDMSWTNGPYGGTNQPCYADIRDPWSAYPDEYGAFVWKTQTKLVADTGGQGQAGATQLYLVRASVTELGYSRVDQHIHGRTPLPPEWVQIGGHTLINTGATNDADGAVWGEAYVQAPAGVNPDVTPVVTQVNANWIYNYNVTVEPVNLTILANGIDLSTNTPEFCAGQLVTFSVNWKPGAPLGNETVKWKVGQGFVNKSDSTMGDAWYYEDTSLEVGPSMAGWFDSASEFNDVQATVNLVFNNGQQINMNSEGSFSVYKPTGSLIEWNLDGAPAVAWVSPWDTTLETASLGVGTPGYNDMSFLGGIDSKYSGTGKWVQKCSLNMTGIGLAQDNYGIPYIEINPDFSDYLDAHDPYDRDDWPIHANATPTGSINFVPLADSPSCGAIILQGQVRLICSFNDYLMFRPDGGDSIFVTLGTTTWSTHSYANWPSSQILPDTSVTGPSAMTPSDNLPSWWMTFLQIGSGSGK